MPYFNMEGLCKTNEHYMVRPKDRLENKIIKLDRMFGYVVNDRNQFDPDGRLDIERCLESL